jgi:hypothetical protein
LLNDIQDLISKLFVRPVRRIYQALEAEAIKKRKSRVSVSNTDFETAPEMARTTFILHGVRDTTQADEIWALVDRLKSIFKTRVRGLGIVVVSDPTLYRRISKDNNILDHFCTIHVSDTGLILYSEDRPKSPVLCEVCPSTLTYFDAVFSFLVCRACSRFWWMQSIDSAVGPEPRGLFSFLALELRLITGE